MELHQAMARGGLTSLRLQRAPGGELELRLARIWDDGLDWSTYGAVFQADQVPCGDPEVMSDAASRALLGSAGVPLSDYEELLNEGGHEMIVLHAHPRLGMRLTLHVHSSRLGANNGHHAIRAGGVRRHEWDEPERDVLIDGLNLARGMSYKNAAARIPFGGCKMTVQSDPIELDDDERLGLLAWAIDVGHFFTGPDMGFTPELADHLRARFTRNIVGGTRGSMGPTGTPTAHGTFLAMVECARERWGTDLRYRSVIVQGVGAVGLPLAGRLQAAGAEVKISDPDAARLQVALEALRECGVVAPERVLSTPCDILAPCAVGGLVDEKAIDGLRCAILCGAANNQLKSVSREGELVLAARLRERDVLYVPEWTHNIAGVVAGREEYLRGDEARPEHIVPHLERVCRDGVRDLLQRARTSSVTTTELAYAQVEDLIEGGLDAAPITSG